MAKIEITRTELVWPGKYREDGALRVRSRVHFPFQVEETAPVDSVCLAGGVTQGGPTLPDRRVADRADTSRDGWTNKLLLGDNLLVMESLLDTLAGKIDLIYVDPPFRTGADYAFATVVGDPPQKPPGRSSLTLGMAYRDTWGRGLETYLSAMAERFRIMRDLLAPTGSLLVHLDYRVAHYVKVLLDEIFGARRMVNEIVWHYRSGGGGKKRFGRKHDTILFYARSETPYFDENADKARVPHDAVIPKKWADKFDPRGKLRPDVWDVSRPPNHASEWVGFPTQKPLALLEIPVTVLCPPDGIVADFFCGSGTTLLAAERLGRRWIGCDIGRWAIHVARKRLLEAVRHRPFDVLTLGRHERRFWQGVVFGAQRDTRDVEKDDHGQGSVRTQGDPKSDPNQDVAYRAFLVEAYGAEFIRDLAHVHGQKGEALVHIGSVDAPVTRGEIEAAADACAKRDRKVLHVLGWEWARGACASSLTLAREKGIDVILIQVPREAMDGRAVGKGDVRFSEVPCLDVRVEKTGVREVRIRLQGYTFLHTSLIPEDVRREVRRWSDYIDYWAVDWDFKHRVFALDWVAFRMHKRRRLPLVSDPHGYEKAGEYCIGVRVVDILGNTVCHTAEVVV